LPGTWYYQNEGVKYYAMVDPQTGSVEVFTLKAEEYKEKNLKDGKMIFDFKGIFV
jgi:Uma2 family endonuclease